jgi:hypothetical protein
VGVRVGWSVVSERKSLQEATAELSESFHKIIDPPLLSVLRFIDRQLRRWPWLYRKLS